MYKIDAVVPVGDGKKLFFCYFRKYFFRFRAIQTFTKFDAKIQSLREKLRKYVFLVFFLRNFLLYSTIWQDHILKGSVSRDFLPPVFFMI